MTGDYVPHEVREAQRVIDTLSEQLGLSQLHHGRYVWKNGAEQVWECADDCPHPSHEEMP